MLGFDKAISQISFVVPSHSAFTFTLAKYFAKLSDGVENFNSNFPSFADFVLLTIVQESKIIVEK